MGTAQQLLHGQLRRLVLFPFVQVVISNEQLVEFPSGIKPLNHGVNPLKIKQGIAPVQLPDLFTVIVGQEPFPLCLSQDAVQSLMILPGKGGVVNILTVKVGWVAVEKGVGAVVVANQDFKILGFFEPAVWPRPG